MKNKKITAAGGEVNGLSEMIIIIIYLFFFIQLCVRGRIHIFKYLERQAAKHERARGNGTKTRRGLLDSRGHATLDGRPHRRHNVDSGYSTSDGFDKRWSQEFNTGVSFIVIILAFLLSYRVYTFFLNLLYF